MGSWWPKEFSWAQEALEEIGIEPRDGGFAYERGPHGFLVHWHRVAAWEPPARLVFTWQIAGDRAPQPDPAKAGEGRTLLFRRLRLRRQARQGSRSQRHRVGPGPERDSRRSDRAGPLPLWGRAWTASPGSTTASRAPAHANARPGPEACLNDTQPHRAGCRVGGTVARALRRRRTPGHPRQCRGWPPSSACACHAVGVPVRTVGSRPASPAGPPSAGERGGARAAALAGCRHVGTTRVRALRRRRTLWRASGCRERRYPLPPPTTRSAALREPPGQPGKSRRGTTCCP
jgi:hypothetical protein